MHKRQLGLVNPLVMVSGGLALLVVLLGIFGSWALASYMDQKNNVDAKIATAVTAAKLQQKTDDTKAFNEAEKQPTRTFTGPADFGSLTFSYPKTWSTFIAGDGSPGRQYEVFFQPDAVINPSGGATKRAYALHVNVDNTTYENSLRTYQTSISAGKLIATTVTINGQTGVRIDGQLVEGGQGSMVMFKIRDKTLRVAAESPSFLADFNNIILPQLKFNN